MSMGFTDSERDVFQYLSDSRELVFGDPLKIQRHLDMTARRTGANLENIHTVLVHDIPVLGPNATPEEKFNSDLMVKSLDDAIEELIVVIHGGFSTKAMEPDGSGLTEAEAMKNYRRFCEYMNKKKVNSGTSPSSSPISDAGPDPRQ